MRKTVLFGIASRSEEKTRFLCELLPLSSRLELPLLLSPMARTGDFHGSAKDLLQHAFSSPPKLQISKTASSVSLGLLQLSF